MPLTRVSVQLPTSPLRGGRDASHALSLRVHPHRGGCVGAAREPRIHALQNKYILEIVTLDVSQPTGMVLNASAF